VKDTAMRKLLGFIGLAVLLGSVPALADWTGKNAAGTTITFKNPGDCTSVVCTPVAQLYDGTNLVTLSTSGADAVSNTLTGVPTYSRGLLFNGTTWDRWLGAANALNSTGTGLGTAQIVGQFDDVAPTAITENQFGNVRMSANRNLYGTIRDAAGNERGANVNASNQLTVSVDGGSVFNTNGQAAMANSSPVTVANDQRVSNATSSAKIDISTATTTQLVALSSTLKIYVTAWDVIAGGTGNFKLVYGTGASCGTGTTDLTGAYNLTAQAGISKGAGIGAVLVVPASNALCATTTQAVQMSGSVAYQQF
jgi:hypothetical protein